MDFKSTQTTTLPIFPLIDIVLFPGTVIPLQVHDRQQQVLITDALASDKTLGLALVQSGAEKIFHNVACMGEIIHSEQVQQGYNILVRGKQRVQLIEEIPSEFYRCFRTELIPKPTPIAWHEARYELAQLQSCIVHLQHCIEHQDQELAEVLRSTADPLELIDILSAVLINDTPTQQKILASVDLKQSLRTLNHCLVETLSKFMTSPEEKIILH